MSNSPDLNGFGSEANPTATEKRSHSQPKPFIKQTNLEESHLEYGKCLIVCMLDYVIEWLFLL